MALPKYLEQEIVKLIYAHKNDLLSEVTNGQAVEFVDVYGYKYGTQFEDFSTDFYQFGPATLEGTGTYYKDTSTGTYYEDFFFNLDVPFFAGDGSSLVPTHIKSIFDSINNYGSGTYHFGGGITMEAFDNNAFQSSTLEVFYNGIQLQTDDSVISSYLSLDSGGTYFGNSNNVTGNYSDLTISENQATLFVNTGASIGATGQIEIYEKLGVLRTNVSAYNATQAIDGFFQIIANPTDTVQPIRFRMSGLKSYATLLDATTDGLLPGDLFIIGSVINIVP